MIFRRKKRQALCCPVYCTLNPALIALIGEWFAVIPASPIHGQYVLVQDKNSNKFIALCEGTFFTLLNGKELELSEWDMLGVITPVDRALRDSCLIDQLELIN